jgi:hypothetical protein
MTIDTIPNRTVLTFDAGLSGRSEARTRVAALVRASHSRQKNLKKSS